MECRVCYDVRDDCFAPCACTGSIQYICPECFLEWNRRTASDTCEMCHASYTLTWGLWWSMRKNQVMWYVRGAMSFLSFLAKNLFIFCLMGDSISGFEQRFWALTISWQQLKLLITFSALSILMMMSVFHYDDLMEHIDIVEAATNKTLYRVVFDKEPSEFPEILQRLLGASPACAALKVAAWTMKTGIVFQLRLLFGIKDFVADTFTSSW